MRLDANSGNTGRMPAIVAVILAVTGTATLLILNSPAGDARANGGGMITAAAAYRAGAVVVTTAPIDPHR
jgi:hypothetical protein